MRKARKSAELLNCGRIQINKVIKEENLSLKEYEDFIVLKLHLKEYEEFHSVKWMRDEKYVNINDALLKWFKTVRAKKISVSGL